MHHAADARELGIATTSKIRQMTPTEPAPTEAALTSPCNVRFCEVNAFGRAVGWDIDFRQLDSGGPEIEARVLAGSQTTVMGFRFDRAYHQRGFAPRAALSFGIPLNGPLDWHRQHIDAPRIVSFNGDSGFDCVSPDGFTGLTLSVAQSWLQTMSASFGMPVPEQLVDTRAGLIFAPSQASCELTTQLRRLLASGAGRFDSHRESELALQLIVAALGDSGCDDKSTFNQRARAIELAINFIEDHRGEATRVSEICRETGVPWRTLDRAFRERFGMGPKAYLTRRRLGGVREALAAGPKDLRIADVANAWGYWHMGQFARDYKRLFGELPSETLRHSGAHL